MAAAYQRETSADGSRDYLEIVGFWKTRWFWTFFILEVFLFGGGYAIASFGTETVGFGAGPDAYLAMGGVMGSLGIVTGILWVASIVLSVYFRYKREFERRMAF